MMMNNYISNSLNYVHNELFSGSTSDSSDPASTEKTHQKKQKIHYFSLRKKGLFFIAFLLFYTVMFAQFLMSEKNILLAQFNDYQQIQKSESILNDANLALNKTYIHLLLETRNGRYITQNSLLHQDFLKLEKQYVSLRAMFPEQAEYYKQIVQLLANLVNSYSYENEQHLLQIFHHNQLRLELLLTENKKKRQSLFDHYHERSHSVALSSLLIGSIGMALFGIIISWFVAHMTNDIRLLQSRVRKIVRGEWGEPVFIKRQDELGQLNKGINEMSQRLENSEKALEIARRKHFDQQKNGAIAHLAAGLVHELGNPVSAILAMTGMLQENQARNYADIDSYLEQVRHYIQRMIAIVEDLTRLGTPPDMDFGLIEINSLINDVCGLVHYDERWFGIDVSLDLSSGLPAVNGITEQLRQVLLNILSNAYDALQAGEYRNKKIQCSTALSSDKQNLHIVIKDNGEGMSQEILKKAFDPLFTTRANEHGAGLGLSLCRLLIEHHGGDISIKSVEHEGTKVLISLPPCQD